MMPIGGALHAGVEVGLGGPGAGACHQNAAPATDAKTGLRSRVELRRCSRLGVERVRG